MKEGRRGGALASDLAAREGWSVRRQIGAAFSWRLHSDGLQMVRQLQRDVNLADEAVLRVLESGRPINLGVAQGFAVAQAPVVARALPSESATSSDLRESAALCSGPEYGGARTIAAGRVGASGEFRAHKVACQLKWIRSGPSRGANVLKGSTRVVLRLRCVSQL